MLNNGRSGALIQVKDNSIIKTSHNIEYNDRLLKQAIKQENFNNIIFKKPNIKKKGFDENNCFYFEMDFITSKSWYEFFLNSNKNKIDNFFNKLLSFINNNLENSTTKDVTSEVYVKLKNIKILDVDINDILNNIIVSNILLPIGYNHGDLTFGNILFSDDIYLIDFLDSYVESPILDIVKLIQETKWKWSMLISNIDNIRLHQIFEYLNNIIFQTFKDKPFWKHIILFDLINLIRIYPYLTNKNEKEHIKKYIIQTYEEFNNTNGW